MPGLALSRAGVAVVEYDGQGVAGVAEEVWQRLEALPDPRAPQGLIYPLAALVAAVLCAMTAAGHDRLSAVGQWLKHADQEDLARLRMPFDPLTGAYRVPDEKTIRVVLDRLDPQALVRAVLGPRRRTLARQQARRRVERVRQYRARRAVAERKARLTARIRGISLDGKSTRAARRADGRRIHHLGVVEHVSGRMLGNVQVDAKHNEVSHFQEILAGMDLKPTAGPGGDEAVTVVTFDALHTVRANLEWLVTEQKVHYAAVIKKNQPNTYRKTKKLPWKKVPPAVTTRDTGHGRIESRTLKAVHVEKLGIDFPHLRQAIQLTRHRQNLRTGKMSHETVFVVTSLTSFQAGPAELAALIRGHWIVEAQHHIRDVSFGEDSSTSRTGHGQSNLATLRGAVINAIKDAGYLYIPEGRRDHVRPIDALYLHGLIE